MKITHLILLLSISSLCQAQECAPVTTGMVSWWRAEGNGSDSIGTNNGALINSVYFEPGEVGQCFHFVSGGNPRLYIPDNPTLALTNSLTIEGWIKPNFGYWIIGRGDDVIYEAPYGLALAGLYDLRIHFLVNASTSVHASLVSPAPVPANAWTHVAATLDDASGEMRLYFNGQLVAETNTPVRATCPLTGANHSVCIGNTPGMAGFPFDGWIDDISLYSRALSQTEIQLIYVAGAVGKCFSGPPVISFQPQGQVGYWGGSISFTVSAQGSPPMAYLWNKDGFPISWATNSTLTLTNLALDSGGNYSVLVSNLAGSVLSSNALLTVNPAGVSLGLYPGLTIQGTPGNNYGIQYTTNVGVNATWLTLTQFTLVQPIQLWIDTDNNATSAGNPRRFYRAVAIP